VSARPAAVLWDMDGTIVDTELVWRDAAHRLVRDAGGTLTRAHERALVGANPRDSARVLRDAGVEGGDTEVFARLSAGVHAAALDADLRYRPGALELLTSLADAGIRQAIVTMSPRSHVDIVAARVPVRFDATVSADDVARGKPHPDAYHLAAARLGVATSECVIIEDSPTGLTSAIASGAVAIAVPCYLAFDTAGAAAEWTGLESRSASDVFDVFALRGSRAPNSG